MICSGMSSLKPNFLKWFTKETKKGTKRYARDAKGRYRKWENADNLDKPKGEYRIVEWTIHFKPTKGDNRPSSIRDFEVRIQLPEGDYDLDEIENIAKELMIGLTNEPMVDESTVDWGKKGYDTIKYSDDDSVRWIVMDTVRPQYKYPKGKLWGTYGEDEE